MGCTGLLITSILGIHYRKNDLVNGYLLIVLVYTSLYALLRATHALGIQESIDQNILGLKRLSIFNFPLLYLFFRKVLVLSSSKPHPTGYHLILPTLFYGSIQVWDLMDGLTPGSFRSTISYLWPVASYTCPYRSIATGPFAPRMPPQTRKVKEKGVGSSSSLSFG